MNEKRIKGGFYLKARKSQRGWIAHAPPHVREIWDYLIHNANYKNHGKIKRGQLLTSYKEILDGLSWKVGYRIERYTKWQCEKAMKVLTREAMIATTKTTRGMIITVLNYELYQDPKNYEGYNEDHNRATTGPQGTDTIRKEGSKEGSKNEKDIVPENPPEKGDLSGTPPYSEIVSYLNEKTGASFREKTKETRRYIKARFNDGFTLEDFKAVIDFKTGQWLTDDKMVEYLRPKTLFCTNFESYLQASGGFSGKPDCNRCWYNRNKNEGYPCRLITGPDFDPTGCKSYKPMEK